MNDNVSKRLFKPIRPAGDHKAEIISALGAAPVEQSEWARDPLFPPRAPDNRSFERAAELEQQQLDNELEVPGAVNPHAQPTADDGLSEVERQQLCAMIAQRRTENREDLRASLNIVISDCQDD